ncbi:hypothetical protein AQUCO_02500227v1 [Aquilegia coerulea]|uniref:Secreted protein n=1 Tax=Aquilegia coerulea TaxID=218851 RepID=A0A2G5DA42_AQUCA|nr:hypothetical protein AQUCO_02500227v1 [Aquilegia coerulea]
MTPFLQQVVIFGLWSLLSFAVNSDISFKNSARHQKAKHQRHCLSALRSSKSVGAYFLSMLRLDRTQIYI